MVTQVDRASRCIVGWSVLTERTVDDFQAMVDRSPKPPIITAMRSVSTASWIYDPGQHQAFSDKSQTYAVEADNADLRHYLARLARRSRCFSRCLEALRGAIKLFVFAWNRRQLFKRAHPSYPAHVRDFVYP